jgi:hypothetical protein
MTTFHYQRPSHRPIPTTRSRLCLTALLAAVAVAGAACDDSSEELHEVRGKVSQWPGDGASAPAARQPASPISDEVGTRAQQETRALITTKEAYATYFGRTPPSGVDWDREWVIFYAAGTRPSGGFVPSVDAVTAVGSVLRVVTRLQTPGNCAVTDALTTPFVLVKIPAQRTSSVEFLHREQASHCGDSEDPCATVLCKPNERCTVRRSLPPQATCEAAPVMENPCAAVLCKAGQICVVQESDPPRAACVDGGTSGGDGAPCMASETCGAGLVCSTAQGVCGRNPRCSKDQACDDACWGTCVKKPEPQARCNTSSQCGAGERCSTERGECLSCSDDRGVICPAVCFGTCEPKDAPLPAGACKADSDCKLAADYCGGCNCRAVGGGAGAAPACMNPVQCFADPCTNQRAVCEAGRCVVRANEAPPCMTELIGSDTSCRTAEEWKRVAAAACPAPATVTQFSTGGGDCGQGKTRYAKYMCCPAR